MTKATCSNIDYIGMYCLSLFHSFGLCPSNATFCHICVCVLGAQTYLTLRPTNCSLLGFSVQGMEFSRQEYWSGLLHPSPGDLPEPGTELASLISLALADRFFTIWSTRSLKQIWNRDSHNRICGVVTQLFVFSIVFTSRRITVQHSLLSSLVVSIPLIDSFNFNASYMPGMTTNLSPTERRISIFRTADEYNTPEFCSNILSTSFPNFSKEKFYFSAAEKF